MSDAVAVILAGGPSTRFHTELPKPLHRAGGRTLLEHVLDAVTRLGVSGVAVVAPADTTPVADLVGGRATCVPGGTVTEGLIRALNALPGQDTVLILPADVPQLRPAHLQALLRFPAGAGVPAASLSVGGKPTGVYVAQRQVILDLDPAALPENLFPGAPACELPGDPLIDVNTRADLARAEKALRRAVAECLMDEGVTILDPDNTYIDVDVRVGQDTIIHPWTVLEGRTEIGKRCTIGPQARLADCKVGDDTTIHSSVLQSSSIGSRVRVGPFANVRPGCEVGDESKIGDFVELKNARLGTHVAISHLAYVGDAVVGSNVNIGAGVITCNYDGYRKHQTIIGDNAFIGSNSVLVAPVTVGNGAYVAAHSAINQAVPDDALGIARARQENREDWARRRRESRGKK